MKRSTKTLTFVLALGVLVLGVSTVMAQKDGGEGKGKGAKSAEKAAEKRSQIDAAAQAGLDEVFESSKEAKAFHEKAYGHAVFTNLKFALGVSGGGGSGVAVETESGRRVYMKMGTAGLGLGLGGQKYQLIFFFEDSKTFQNFIDKGWEANAQASAVAGTKGANAEATFTNGIAVFQITDKGLMLSADIAGTKYWQNKKLNK